MCQQQANNRRLCKFGNDCKFSMALPDSLEFWLPLGLAAPDSACQNSFLDEQAGSAMKCRIWGSIALLCGWQVGFAQTAQPYEYVRGEYVVPCPDDDKAECRWHRLVVDNRTADTLECKSRISYSGINRNQAATFDHQMVVVPNARRAVLADTTNPDVTAQSHSVECRARPRTDDSKLTPQCKATLTKKPSGGIDYPPDSRKAGQEGPVMLEFSLSDKEGPPTDILIVGSSLWPKLDESAKKYVGQYTGKTDCKQGRFRMPLIFRLD
jgi:TonB family protein